ncbi:hypothetical protein ACQVP2_31045 [Methylobacterium aquaticum]|uniref:hypothetical protein n=1 Tax=Methylobacterium aquaticum TaxID=270351 RepID=UPI0018CF0CF3|nr:hypothetical protein [Methylobacterium aquaticum]
MLAERGQERSRILTIGKPVAGLGEALAQEMGEGRPAMRGGARVKAGVEAPWEGRWVRPQRQAETLEMRCLRPGGAVGSALRQPSVLAGRIVGMREGRMRFAKMIWIKALNLIVFVCESSEFPNRTIMNARIFVAQGFGFEI